MALHDAQFTGEGWFDPYAPGRDGGWFDSEFIELEAAAPAAANPVVRFRYGQGIVEATPPLVAAAFFAFPFFQAAPAAANAVIEFRQGRPAIEQVVEPTPRPQYLRFPFFQEAAPAANPVIGYRFGQGILDAGQALALPRYHPLVPFPAVAQPLPFRQGQPILEDVALLVLPHYTPLPYFQGEAAANPIIAYLRGQWLGDAVRFPESIVARYFPFPYFEQPPVAPANPVIPFLTRRLEELEYPRPEPRSGYFPFPYFSPIPATIPFRYGQGILVDPLAFVMAHHLPFPYFQVPAPANLIIPMRARRLSELQDFQRHPLPQFYGYVESNEEVTPVTAARYIPQFRRRRR